MKSAIIFFFQILCNDNVNKEVHARLRSNILNVVGQAKAQSSPRNSRESPLSFLFAPLRPRLPSNFFNDGGQVCERFRLLHALPFLCFLISVPLFSQQEVFPLKLQDKTAEDLRCGASQTEKYLPLLKNKSVAVVANAASLVKNTHLVDTLMGLKVHVKKVFAPEHGFRGNAEAGKKIANQVDEETRLPVISLYGKNFKPGHEDLKDVDVVVFDLQDVGVRFYTYISTLHYVMEACAENKKQLIVLDRPNPNGYFVDGPILEPKFKSFSGMHPVPIVYGMTIGEYAKMINGEKWLAGGVQCNLTVIPIESYSHSDLYQLPVKPSPNLPNMCSVYLYPSLCLFEGTIVSVGRGTDKPFQVFGYPQGKGPYAFTPMPVKGASENPMYNGQLCWGYDVSNYGEVYLKYAKVVNLYWIINLYKNSPVQDKFFNNYFNSLAGTDVLKKQIMAGKTEEEIRATWQPGLRAFKEVRKKYLLYPDFE